MTEFRDHVPVVVEEFNGLWKRGDADSTPPDHFSDCNNIAYIQSGFEWRDGIDPYRAIPDMVRIYTFTKQTGQSLLVLDSLGNIWDTDYYPGSPVLTISGMTDFGFAAFAGRAYISPSNGSTGLATENLYVYLGDGTTARKAGGAKPTNADGALAAANSGGAGNIEAGIHVFACVYETNTGFLTAIGPGTLPTVTAPGGEAVNLTNIPVSPNSYVQRVHIIATKAIDPTFYTGNTTGYQFFFVPNGDIVNGTTSLSVSFFDSELLEDASYLLDMFEDIPAFAGLSTYHNRLVGWAEQANESVIRISVQGEPEAFNQVDGLVIFPLDGNPVTNIQEFRDIMYGFKKTKTNAWTDSSDAPSSWLMTVLDQGLGTGLHGIAKVLDSEGVNVDFLIICGFTGIYLFNGAYQAPELTFKIRDLWLALDRDRFHYLQPLNDGINQQLHIVLPDGTMLHADYSNGLDPKNVRFSPWSFVPYISSIALINGNNLILASLGLR